MMVEEGKSHPQGEALLEELRWIHGIIRSNLAAIQGIIDEINRGSPADAIRAQVDGLAANSAVWSLRINCLQYCHLVHSHHHHEDVGFFPALCRINPALRPVTDKLQADHAVVSDLLDKVEAAAARILKEESARVELVASLRELSEHLITHLDYEEENLAPTLRRLRGWPR